MMNKYDQLQVHTLLEATKLAANGQEFSHLIKLLTPEYAMRLQIYVQQLPEAIQEKTIYGRAHFRAEPASKKKR